MQTMFPVYVAMRVRRLFGRTVWAWGSSNPWRSTLMILFNDFQLAIQISKDALPGRVPLWVILLSAFAGLLLLTLLILALWKVSAEVLSLSSSIANGNW